MTGLLIQKNMRLLSLLLLSLLTLRTAPAQTPKPTTYVIVHGAWGGSWAFKKVDSLLTAQGHVVYRPALTGQGERVHLASPEVNLSTHIEDVVNTILFENLRDVVLVGHSYGGMVVTGVADRVPDRIKRLVYLDAFVPNDGESVFSAQGTPADGGGMKAMLKDGFIVPPWAKAEQPVPKDVPQSLKTFTEPISLKNAAARQVPATYILTVDPGKTPGQDGFAKYAERAKQRGFTFHQMLETDHNPQWSKPVELTTLLLQAR